MPWPTLVTALASSLLVSKAFFLGWDDCHPPPPPQDMRRSYISGMADEKDLVPPVEGIIEPCSQGHWPWDKVSASSMQEMCPHMKQHTYGFIPWQNASYYLDQN